MEPEEPPRCSGGTRSVSLPEDQRFVTSWLSQVIDPASAVAAQPPLVGDSEFVFRHDSASSTVRLYGYYLDPANPEDEGEPDEEDDDIYAEEVLPEEERQRVEYEPLTEEEMAERNDSDDDDDDEDRQPSKVGDAGESSIKSNSIALVDAPDGGFLGPAQFATVINNTAGFMRIAAGTGSQQGGGSDKEILVLYRYTRFSRTWSGRRGVEACRRTKLHWLRFAVPPAGNMRGALAWAGSSLCPLIYPGLFRQELGDLWSILAALVINAIPPQATRLQVVVDAGILRREDYTMERMEHVRGALEATAGEAWPEYYHVGMELQLPETVRREEGGDADEDDGVRTAKRRMVVAEGDCSLCLDPLESGLAAWPGCGHVFHGHCVEQTLAGRATCPQCRHGLCRHAA